ncbi:hypothetical protein GJ496_007650 [Pomphorhynchus laevis]|nr:hypothetical protein GJ496_007650 [Pomphorhynchus laevis]
MSANNISSSIASSIQRIVMNSDNHMFKKQCLIISGSRTVLDLCEYVERSLKIINTQISNDNKYVDPIVNDRIVLNPIVRITDNISQLSIEADIKIGVFVLYSSFRNTRPSSKLMSNNMKR